MPNFGWLDRVVVFKKTLFIFESFDPTAPQSHKVTLRF
jgi:hypothetical protein